MNLERETLTDTEKKTRGYQRVEWGRARLGVWH